MWYTINCGINHTDALASFVVHYQIDGLMQERHNSIALAMELCLSCTNPSKCGTNHTDILASNVVHYQVWFKSYRHIHVSCLKLVLVPSSCPAAGSPSGAWYCCINSIYNCVNGWGLGPGFFLAAPCLRRQWRFKSVLCMKHLPHPGSAHWNRFIRCRKEETTRSGHFGNWLINSVMQQECFKLKKASQMERNWICLRMTLSFRAY